MRLFINFVKKNIPFSIICLFHSVGLIGFLIEPHYFKSLSPLNLLLSAVLVVATSQQTHIKFYGTLVAIAICGFAVEVAGVKTELIFGSYYYGQALGYKLLAVPLLIGVNWALLLYSTAQWSLVKHPIAKALLGALLMVILDFFIEQQAPSFDFWYWKNNIIPLQNYMAWFVVSFGLHLLFQNQLAQKVNKTAKGFYAVQLLFFGLLFFFK